MGKSYIMDSVINSNTMVDNVNHPKHYTKGNIQPIDFINAHNLDYLEGNIVKYIARYKFKGGVEDLEKAEFYLRMLLQREKVANDYEV